MKFEENCAAKCYVRTTEAAPDGTVTKRSQGLVPLAAGGPRARIHADRRDSCLARSRYPRGGKKISRGRGFGRGKSLSPCLYPCDVAGPPVSPWKL
jgi:hypothetical protein